MSHYYAAYLRPDVGPSRLLLFYEDKRMAKKDAHQNIVMNISDLLRVHEFVSTYFRIEEDWSEKLIERLFDEDLRLYQYFELGRRERDDISYHIRVLGNTDDLWEHNSDIEYNPISKNQKLTIRLEKNKTETKSVWSYERLKATKMDNSVIALFNNNTFNSLTESNRAGTLKRFVQVIDFPDFSAKL